MNAGIKWLLRTDKWYRGTDYAKQQEEMEKLKNSVRGFDRYLSHPPGEGLLFEASRPRATHVNQRPYAATGADNPRRLSMKSA